MVADFWLQYLEVPRPFFTFWSFGAYLVPLAVYELYLRAQKAAAPAQFVMVASIVA
jgi:hypothetical protein